MAEVTVAKLAEIVGAPVDRLLMQMKEAGLEHVAAKDKVSDEEKQTLLSYLKRCHGDSDTAPKKITLKRKVTTQLKTSSTQGRSAKTVNVEVRKKRTYVKRSAIEAQQSAEKLEAEVLRREEEKRLEEEQAAILAAEQAELEKQAKVEQAETAPELEVAAVQEETMQSGADAEISTAPAEEVEVGEPSESDDEPAVKELSEAERLKLEKEERESLKTPDKKAKKVEKSKTSKKKWIEEADEIFEEEILHKPAPKRVYVEPKIAKPTKFLKQHGFARPAARVLKEVAIPDSILVSELAQRMSVKATDIIRALMKMGVMTTINQAIDQETAVLVVEEMGHKYRLEQPKNLEQELLKDINYEGEEVARAPVVTVMGHVDHGKTSLLDYIRKTKVTAGESGGITQHIGAYHVETDKGMVCFLDTPGHAAFTAMRARGAQATDIVILVVAADDGVMPQTEEAIQHARSAGVPIVVAINKIDKESADIDRVKNELVTKDVIPEDWGGDVQFIPVSAHTGKGIDDLLDAVLLQAEILELKAVPEAPARGVVVEARLDKGRGAVATLLVQNGTLEQGNAIIAGQVYGRARALMDENGKTVKRAGPSIPVEVLGLTETPNAGDDFLVLPNERMARELAEYRKQLHKVEAQASRQAVQLENLFANMGEGQPRILNIVLKTDVRGSLEALSSALEKIGNDEVKVAIVSSGVGGISETDANLAVSTGAVVIGFNVRADASARKVFEENGTDLRYYSVIYDIVDDVKNALSGMLAPEYKETIVGVAEVRDIFTSPKYGSIAGSMVIEGTIYRNKPIRVLRDDVVIYEGELESLRRFKDDANEVRSGMECGIGVKNYTDVKVGDKIEVYDLVAVERTL
ncbi:MAG: translation initiation factor IF-2 [Pseudomonadales bacterium]|nr:translation initiation factor IF-2 [Pseudomonadales bacterium]